MKLSHKIKKLGQPLTYQRAWRHIQRRFHPIPLGPLLAQIDQDQLRELQARFPAGSQHYAKYLNVKKYLKRDIVRVQDLQLHRSPPMDILDIGCGPGFFLFISKQFGHSVLGLDTDEFPIFAELTSLLSVPRTIGSIRAFEPLPNLGRTFDYITAFSTVFHGSDRQPWHWGVKEWDFFLNDIANHLKPGGRLFLGLNASYDGNYYTQEILDLFLSRGAVVERENILFPAPGIISVPVPAPKVR